MKLVIIIFGYLLNRSYIHIVQNLKAYNEKFAFHSRARAIQFPCSSTASC